MCSLRAHGHQTPLGFRLLVGRRSRSLCCPKVAAVLWLMIVSTPELLKTREEKKERKKEKEKEKERSEYGLTEPGSRCLLDFLLVKLHFALWSA